MWGPVHWTRPGGDEGSVGGAELVAALDGGGLGPCATPTRRSSRPCGDGAPADPDFASALRAHLLADALYRSAAEGGSSLTIPAGEPAAPI